MAKRTKDLIVVTAMGFASGLPFPLVGGTLQAWLTKEGVDLATIGIFTVITFPYSFKFIWAPFFDHFSTPWLGKRRGWILTCQVLILIGLTMMITSTPSNLALLSVFAFSVAFFSASQDISIDAYRTEILKPKDRGLGVSFAVTAYRIALLISGGLCLILADHVGFQLAMAIISTLLLVGIVSTILGDEPPHSQSSKIPSKSILEPFRELLRRDKSLVIILFVALYKIGDAYAGSLSTAFFLRGVGFSLTEVGAVNKIGGLISSIVGALIGGVVLTRLNLYRALILFGLLQAMSNLMFILLALSGKNYTLFFATVVVENFTGGMGTTAFLALLIGLCRRGFAATQYALLSSVASLGRILVSPTSGYVVESLGWVYFYLITFFVALPGIVLIFLIKDIIESTEEKSDHGEQKND